MIAGFLIMGASTPGVVIAAAGGAVSYALSLAVSLASGLVPVVLFAAAARHAPSPAHVGATMGMAMQGNNLGLLIGPAAAGAIADAWGWLWVAVWVGLLACLALALIAVLRRMPLEQGPAVKQRHRRQAPSAQPPLGKDRVPSPARGNAAENHRA
jgi:MFS family permease